MTSPLRISTDTSAQIAQLRAQIAQLKTTMADPVRRARPRDTTTDATNLADLQSQLTALTNPDQTGPGNNLVAPPPAAPTFAGARIDIGQTGVDALKLISYPGLT